jgi:hypothetical protein
VWPGGSPQVGACPDSAPSRPRTERARRDYRRKLDGHGAARLVAVACSQPPAGRSRWTLRLLAEQLVVLEVVDQVSHECVRQTLKKTHLSLG